MGRRKRSDTGPRAVRPATTAQPPQAVADVQLRLDRLLAAIPVLDRNLDHSDAQHARIVSAILAGDPAGARAAMEEHCEATATLFTVTGFILPLVIALRWRAEVWRPPDQ